jgi:hypothetical protein
MESGGYAYEPGLDSPCVFGKPVWLSRYADVLCYFGERACVREKGVHDESSQ